MKAFVTGGSGFIGSHVVQKLVERGYQVNALVRNESSAFSVRRFGAQPIWGDIIAPETLRDGLRGCDVVFHIAGWYRLGASDWRKAELINVEGTRNVLTLAWQLRIPRILYTSTVTVFGDTHGVLVDETYQPQANQFLNEYDRTKWIAHYQIAVPLIQQGAPIIIALPGVAFGPGDPSLVGDLMRCFYWGLMPVLPGPETSFTYAHVEDIAEGLILAAEKGSPGESYILAGPYLDLAEAINLWSLLTGKRYPLIKIPARYLKPFAPLLSTIQGILPLPPILSRDAVSVLGATYLASAEKARKMLGWRPQSLAAGFRETFAAIAQEKPPVSLPAAPKKRRTLATVALGSALGLLSIWMFTRWLRSERKRRDLGGFGSR
jgi:nucleoside-diphosphate-sugar epimerase